MKSEFNILISFRTPDGFKNCGQYFLGKDRPLAEDIFKGLTGREDPDDKAVLHLDLVETSDGLPVRVKTICCRLSELCSNCQHITRELFRAHAIEPH
jgi:hypothetical protein